MLQPPQTASYWRITFQGPEVRNVNSSVRHQSITLICWSCLHHETLALCSSVCSSVSGNKNAPASQRSRQNTFANYSEYKEIHQFKQHNLYHSLYHLVILLNIICYFPYCEFIQGSAQDLVTPPSLNIYDKYSNKAK